MNIVNKLTLRHMKTNRGRTIVTTLGIAAAVALITAIFVSLASFLDMTGEICLYSSGNRQSVSGDVSPKQLDELRKDDRVSMAGASLALPEENAFQLDGAASRRTGRGDVMAADTTAMKQLITCKYDGELPQNENEIALEEKVIKQNRFQIKPGDIIEVNFGKRTIESEGQEMPYSGGFIAGEKFAEGEKRTVKVTAILHQNVPTSSFKMIRGMSEAEKKENADVSITLKKIDHSSLKELKKIVKKYDLHNTDYETIFLETKFAVDENSSTFKNLLPVIGIALAIVMAASIVLIYNAFAMLLSERVRYLGMLASIGATKRQKRNSVYFEVFLQTMAGLILGIVVGIIGISITLNLVGGKIISTGMVQGVTADTFSMRTVVPWWSVCLIIFISFITVLISALVPARRASAISPMDAIRQTGEIRIRKKKIRTPFYIRKIFGYEGELAHKSLKRNSRKSKIITRSIGFSVILFLCINYFCQLLIESNGMQDSQPHQIVVLVSQKDKEEMKQKIEQLDDVDEVLNVSGKCYIYDMSSRSAEDKRVFSEDTVTSGYQKAFKDQAFVYINLLDNEIFDEMCRKNHMDPAPFYGDTCKGLLMNNIQHTKDGGNVFTNQILHKKFVSEDGKEGVEIENFISYDSDLLPCRFNASGAVSVYMPESTYVKKYKNNAKLGVVTSRHEKVTEEIQQIIEEGGYKEGMVIDNAEAFQTMNTVIFIMQVFIYGFIVLITLITIANIINTISTGISLRRKEFAMLKSVGITPKGFRKMICLECFFYGERALIAAIPVSLFLCYNMNVNLNAASVPFFIPWKTYLIVIAAVFVLVGLSMYYAMYKLRNDSIIETLKEEVL